MTMKKYLFPLLVLATTFTACTDADNDPLLSPQPIDKLPTAPVVGDCDYTVQILPADEWPSQHLERGEVVSVDGTCVAIKYSFSGCGEDNPLVSLYTDGSSKGSSISETSASLISTLKADEVTCTAYYVVTRTFDVGSYVSLPTKLTIATAEGDTTLLIE